jgi:hypothetical protein
MPLTHLGFACSVALLALILPTASAALPPVTSGLEAQFVGDDVVPTMQGTVDTWADSSGAGISADEPTASEQPQLLGGVLNGHDVVHFDGVDDGLKLSTHLFSSTSFPKTVFAVVRSQGDSNGHIVGTGSSSVGAIPTFGSGLVVVEHNYFYKAASSLNGLRLVSPETTLAADWQVVVATISAGASRLETNCTVAESSAALNSFDSGETKIGSITAFPPVHGFEGQIAELLIYDRALADVERNDVRTSLAQTYGLPNPDRTDTDGDGFVDDCDSGQEYLQSAVTLITPADPQDLNGNIINAIDLSDPLAEDAHSNCGPGVSGPNCHVWNSAGPVVFDMHLLEDHDLTLVHFWNYSGETFDVDDVSISFRDAQGIEVASFDFSPGLSQTFADGYPIYAQDFALTGVSGVRTLRIVASGDNASSDFQNFGVTGSPASASIPLLGPWALLALGAGLALFAAAAGMRKMSPRAGTSATWSPVRTPGRPSTRAIRTAASGLPGS